MRNISFITFAFSAPVFSKATMEWIMLATRVPDS